MKVQGIKNSKNNYSVTFGAGVTHYFTDLKMNHIGNDVFKKVRANTLTHEEVEAFNKAHFGINTYFDVAGESTEKFKMTGFIYNNHNETGLILNKMNKYGLNFFLPNAILTDKGGARYTVQKSNTDDKIKLFFNDTENISRTFFIKQESAWDSHSTSKKFIEVIQDTLLEQNKSRTLKDLYRLMGGKASFNQEGKSMLENIFSTSKNRDEVKEKIIDFYNKNNLDSASPIKRLEFETQLNGFLDALDKIKKTNFSVLEIPTTSKKYPELDDYDAVLKKTGQDVKNGNFIGMLGDNEVKFSAVLPDYFSSSKAMKKVTTQVNKVLAHINIDGIVSIRKKQEQFPHPVVSVKPRVAGRKLNNIGDIKSALQETIKSRSNDFVMVAASRESGTSVLNLYNYVFDTKPPKDISPSKLKEVFKLPLAVVFIDDSTEAAGKAFKGINADIAHMDNVFNSDGNVRFIHMTPNIVGDGKPKTLEDAFLIAQKSFANRNKSYLDAMPKRLKRLLMDINPEYPIERKVSKKIEKMLGEKIWEPGQYWAENTITHTQNTENAKTIFTRLKSALKENKMTAVLGLSCVLCPIISDYFNQKREVKLSVSAGQKVG